MTFRWLSSVSVIYETVFINIWRGISTIQSRLIQGKQKQRQENSGLHLIPGNDVRSLYNVGETKTLTLTVVIKNNAIIFLASYKSSLG